MYMEEVYSEEIKVETSKLLKSIGVKHVLKKLDQKLQVDKKVELYHVFKTSIELLEKETISLAQSTIPVEVPVFVIDSCEFINQNVRVEGLFRKAGSTSKQRELRALLDCGNRLEVDADHNVINVANILKLFFRELPEPLIPYRFHDLFLKCLVLKENKKQAILLGCLLLPSDHLNTLAYLMQFLQNVATNNEFNKMDVGNLSIIFTPTIMPVSAPKLTPHGGERINHHVQIVRILIESAEMIGVVPETICEKLGLNPVPSVSDTEEVGAKKLRKKKRSGSLTRMLSGLKKIISKHASDDTPMLASEVYIHTPKILSARKRKAEAVTLSSKKKREVIKSLPQGLTLANTLYTPRKNKAVMLSPRDLVAQPSRKHISPSKVKKKFTFQKMHSAEMVDKNDENVPCPINGANKEITLTSGDVLSSAVSQCSCSSYGNISSVESPPHSEEYVRIPKIEYEAIKDRVSQMESRIDHELGNILGMAMNDFGDTNTSCRTLQDDNNCVDDIQCAYAKTMEHSERLNNSATEHLTRKLSKELKIRRSSEQRIIRSPSARKIGTIRRRSKENVFPRRELSRHYSLNSCDIPMNINSNSLYSTRSLRRGRPNTVYSGLRQPNPLASQSKVVQDSTSESSLVLKSNLNMRKSKLKCRPSSFNARLNTKETFSNMKIEENCASNLDGSDTWTSAKDYLNNKSNDDLTAGSDRESIAKIRKQNVGMVMAKAKLFDSLSTKEKSRENSPTLLDHCKLDKRVSEIALNPISQLHGSGNTHRGSLDSKSPKLRNDKKFNGNSKKDGVISLLGKENQGDMPYHTGSSIYSSTRVPIKLSGSPLKDCNRIITPIIPNIKHSSSFRASTKNYHKSCVENTSVSVLSHTPRRSPRLVSIKNRTNVMTRK